MSSWVYWPQILPQRWSVTTIPSLARPIFVRALLLSLTHHFFFRGRDPKMIMEYFPAAQRRGNKYYFVASKDDCGCCSCRYAAKSSVICRTSSRQLQIRYDQQRDKLFPPTSTLNILSLLVADIMVLTLAALGALFKQFLFTGFGWSYLGCQ